MALLMMKLGWLTIAVIWTYLLIQWRLFSRLKHKHRETYVALGEPSISNYWKTGRRFDRFAWRDAAKLGDPTVDFLVALRFIALVTGFVLGIAFLILGFLEEYG